MIAPISFFFFACSPGDINTGKDWEKKERSTGSVREDSLGREFVPMKRKWLRKGGSLAFQFPQIIPCLQFGTYLGGKHKHSCTSNHILLVPLLVFSVPTNKLTQSWIVRWGEILPWALCMEKVEKATGPDFWTYRRGRSSKIPFFIRR